MRLVFPTLEVKDQAIDFINELREYGSEIDGTGSLDEMLRTATYEDWLKKVIEDVDVANLRPGRVPALTYFYVREEDNRVVGMTNIRLRLNDFLRTQGGHIGYCIRPSERRKGYATSMLKEALRVCGTMGIDKVIVTCDTVNIASAKTIQNNGGVLDAEFYSDVFETDIQRYIIDISEE
ncbi:MAG: GNAT family N-acetyltransferase [Clostridiales bacterium]|nr:GNAT family N-acetyltransferase [Clostridiales bacterium]